MNLKQLSEMLDLSQTTISRALNGYPEVSAATRARVVQAVKDTGYRPNRVAQRLATGKARSIGLVMPTSPGHSSDVHFAEFLSGLGEAALRHDFHLLIMPSEPDREAETLKRLIESGDVDAVFIAYIRRNDTRLEMLADFQIPFILHGRAIGATTAFPYLDIDNEAAFHAAARLLLQLGHRRFALINGQAHLAFAIQRRQGVVDALHGSGLDLHQEFLSETEMTDEAGFRAMDAMLRAPQRPTAVLCSSTVLALGAVRAINQAGLRLGEDISLIAHDDVLPLLRPENFSVPLTTTRSSLRDAGIRIAQRLIDELRHGHEGPPMQELWKTELIVRASTGPVAP